MNKKIKLDLIGLNSNAFSLMANFRKQALREDWTGEEIDFVLDKAKQGDFDNLLNVLMEYCEDE